MTASTVAPSESPSALTMHRAFPGCAFQGPERAVILLHARSKWGGGHNILPPYRAGNDEAKCHQRLAGNSAEKLWKDAPDVGLPSLEPSLIHATDHIAASQE